MVLRDIENIINNNEEREEINLFILGLVAVIAPVVLVSLVFLIADSGFFGVEKGGELEASFEFSLFFAILIGLIPLFYAGLEELGTKIIILAAIAVTSLAITSLIFKFATPAAVITFGIIGALASLGVACYLKKGGAGGNELFSFVLLAIAISTAANILTVLILRSL